MNSKILAIIPARGGSKSVPKKNLVKVGGKSLLRWTIEASLRSKYICKTVVSSEDETILKISKKYGAETVVRPEKYSRDDTSMVSVVKDCLKQLIIKKENFDIVVILQPTSPLRNTNDIDSAFKIFFQKKATALISGYEPEKSPYKAFRVTKSGLLHGLVNNKTPFKNRQLLSPAFYPNGAIYMIFVKEFLKENNFLTSKTIPFTMSIEKSIDIDSLEDVKKIDLILRNDNIT